MLRFVITDLAPKCIPIGILAISSCADERPPTGGRKDSIPPKLKSADPKNKTLNFNSEKIKLEFNEFIQQTLDPKEIVVSPPMDKKPKMQVNGKVLNITLKSKLKENTTYTINFGDAIKDLNEGNILKNFSYVFATGPILDTAAVSGLVSNIAVSSELSDIIIGLYPIDSVDGILHSKPYYFAKTDKAGHYSVNNVHPGCYRVYALKDQNLNYIYDQSDELIGFLDTSLTLADSSKAKIDMSVFLSIINRPKFTDALSTSPGKMLITYNAPLTTFKINSDISSKKDIIEINDRKDSIIYWYSNIYASKMAIVALANDTISDSARIDMKTFNKDSLNNNKKYSLTIDLPILKTDSNGKSLYSKPILSPFNPVILTLTRPVDSINQNKPIILLNDSTKKTDSVSFSLDPKTKRKITLNYKQLEKTSYTLTVPDSALLDIFGWWNKSFSYKWISDANDNYGNMILNVKIEHPEKHYILKLLNMDNVAIRTFLLTGEQEKKISLQNLKAGSYHLQAIDDTNNNGEWDSGNFSKKLQPEKVINFHDSYELKGNWDLEVDVKL